MPYNQFGFLVFTLEELHQHLKEELARNPFLDAPTSRAEQSEKEDQIPPLDEAEGPS